jgi:hypothetical protein
VTEIACPARDLVGERDLDHAPDRDTAFTARTQRVYGLSPMPLKEAAARILLMVASELTRTKLAHSVCDLREEFADLPPEVVEQAVLDCAEELLLQARIEHYIPLLAYRWARETLAASLASAPVATSVSRNKHAVGVASKGGGDPRLRLVERDHDYATHPA